jgi:hypothetical protein
VTRQHCEAAIRAVERWACEEIDRLVYAGTRPVSTCPTVAQATHEAAIARGNTIAHSAEIAEIESVTKYLCAYLLERFTSDAFEREA